MKSIMFYRFFIAVSFSLLSSLSHANLKSEWGELAEGQGRLIISRKRLSPPLSYKPMISINETKAFYLPRGYYAVLDLDPGEYTLLADWKVLHGVPDQKLSVKVTEGTETYINVSSSLNLTTMLALGVTSFGSQITSTNQVPDLSKSKRISRWDKEWLKSSIGGFSQEETLNERYEITLNTALLLEDFEKASGQKKYEITRYLLHHEIYEEEILMAFEDEVMENYKLEFSSKEAKLPIIFMCKYIASSKMNEFKPIIEEVAINAADKKVRKYAQSFLSDYF